MSQRRVLPEDERRELRIWMRRKQREQLAVYQKQRESLRQRERKPFSSAGAAVREASLELIFFVVVVFLDVASNPVPSPCRKQRARNEQECGETERKETSMHLFPLPRHKTKRV